VLIDKNQSLKEAKINEFEFGLRPNFTKIGIYLNNNYAHKKYLLNPLAGYGNVDLILTGATVNSLFTVAKTGRFVFDSSNSKWNNLLSKYGNDIEGLNQNTFEKIQATEHAPILANYINEELGLK
jgi:hypothetical protein